MDIVEYRNQLETALFSKRLPSNAVALLHGAGSAVSQSYSTRKRKRHGIFLSTIELASGLAATLEARLQVGDAVFDPAAGCGDLLLAYATKLPTQSDLRATLAHWSRLLWAFERDANLLEIAKLRLGLLARMSHPEARSLSADSLVSSFPGLIAADFLTSDLSCLPPNLCVAANPPFTVGPAPRSSILFGRKASAAAIFLEKICRETPSFSEIAILLPEVLRCGTSYRKLRSELEHYVEVKRLRSLERRDCWLEVDVNVFLGHYSRRTTTPLFASTFPQPLKRTRTPARTPLADLAHLSVGPVVEYRAPEKGPWRKYITARSAPAWGTYLPTQSRRFTGPSLNPPFVVVRRTSRPDRQHRAVATVIIGSNPVAVENHLIILRPRDGRLSTCQKILQGLKDQSVNKQLDEAMRCRHLTIGSLAQVHIRV